MADDITASMPFRWGHWCLKSAVISIALLFATDHMSAAADAYEYAVEISVDVLNSPFALQLNWPSNESAKKYTVRRRRPGEFTWSSPLATLPANSTGYTDSGVADGIPYEYEVEVELNARGSTGSWLRGHGYAYAGANVSSSDTKGRALLVVDASVAAALANELNTFQKDLIGSGWSVARRDVARTASPAGVRSEIRAAYNADPSLRSVVLIGHVPVPYSGNIAPDLHETHRGAWPADGYYGEINGTWTDSTVNVSSFDHEDNDNRPGDGKFDQSQFPGAVDLEVGRIDFWELPAFSPRSEVDLLRNYFRKNHAFRHREFTAARRGLIRDNFGDLDGDAPAVDAWRHYTQFFGPGNVREVGAGAFLPTLGSESFLWAYGGGGGGYTKADGVGTTYEFAVVDPKAVFLILHGSYFGDWNNSDNLLRAGIATPNYTLASIWSGLPHWFMHPMGLGATVGFCTRLTQNNVSDYKSYKNFAPNQVHIALVGDPTLEMYPVIPPSNLTASAAPAVTLNWNGVPEDNLVGYHVYYSGNATGPFQRITSSPVTGTTYSHNVGAGTYHYMVRALKLERTGSGTFYNLSQGAMAMVTQGSGGTMSTVSVFTRDDEASEVGSNTGEFRFTRSAAGESPVTIEILIGGTAQNGVDYQAIPASVTIPAGSTEVAVALVPISDSLTEGDETITVQIRPNGAYTVGSPAVGFARIRDAVVSQPQAPVVSPIADQWTPANRALTVNFQISDPDTPAENLTVRGLSSNPLLIPQSGLIFGGAGVNRTLTIVPVAGGSGDSSITVFASDGEMERGTAFTVTVMQPNLPPSAQAQTISTLKNTAVSIVLTGSDPEGSNLTFMIKSAPAKGTLLGNPPTLSYQPSAGVTGSDSFSFAVSDGQLESGAATISIQITETNRPPEALPQQVIVAEDNSLAISLGGLDPDGDQLQFELVTGTSKGVLSGRDGTYIYTPIANVTGADSFTFVVNDGKVDSLPATVSIQVDPRNDLPTISAVSAQVGSKNRTAGPWEISVQDVDRPIAELVVSASSSNTNLVRRERIAITGSGTTRHVSITPETSATGSTIITLTVSDGEGLSQSSFELTVTNTPPVVTADVVNAYGPTVEIPAAFLIGNDFDADGDLLQVVFVSPSASGRAVELANGLVTYHGGAETNRDSFEYTVEDNSGTRSNGIVTINLSASSRIESIRLAATDVILRVNGAPLGGFRVESSSDARAWTEIGNGTADAAGHGEIRVVGGAGAHHRFYRTVWR